MSTDMHGPTDAVEQWAHSYQPVNGNGQASAEQVLRTLDGIAEHTEATSRSYRLVGEKITDEVAFDDGSADLIHKVAAEQAKLVDPIREVKADIERIHADQLDRIRRGDPRTAAWDWSANQDDVLT